MTISPMEELLYTTVHILAESPNESADGTGFFYRMNVEQGGISLLITNKHVVVDATSLTIVLHKADHDGNRTGAFARVTLQIAPSGIVDHPDADVDLCAISLDMNQIVAIAGSPIFNKFLTSGSIPSLEQWGAMDAFEELIMVGCPNGLHDTVNFLPIARRGIAASHPSFDFDGRPEFVIDAACFPGSSGSPVFLVDKLGIVDKITQGLNLAEKRRALVGILYSGPLITNEGVVLKRQKKFAVETMMHLGYVIKATELLMLEQAVAARFNQQASQ
jgi:hypothetical protein